MSRLKPSKLVPGVDQTDKSIQYTADFLAAILTWGGIGWVADRALGTTPVLMVLGFIVGNTAGLYLLYIRSRDGALLSNDRVRSDNPQSQADSDPR